MDFANADEFGARDFRYSNFLMRSDVYSQPAVHLKWTGGKMSFESYVGSLQYSDQYRVFFPITNGEKNSFSLDYGARLAITLAQKDVHFSIQSLRDRKTLFVPKINSNFEVYLEKHNPRITHYHLGYSQELWDGVLRVDVAHSQNRSYLSTLGVLKKYHRNFAAISYDSPDFGQWIYGFNYSTENLIGSYLEDHSIPSRSEWIAFSARRLSNRNELFINGLYNHHDRNSAWFFQYKWSTNRFTELFIRYEFIPETQKGILSSYSDTQRALFGMELMMSYL